MQSCGAIMNLRACFFPLLMLLPVSPAGAGQTSASASASAVILPASSLNGQISVTPQHISLTKGGHGKFTVTNHSGDIHTITVEVEPTIYGVCRLTYTPKQVVLADKEYQVFRLFYVTEDGRNCTTTFRLRIHYNDYSDHELVDVDCD
jgi:hypothetical protein